MKNDLTYRNPVPVYARPGSPDQRKYMMNAQAYSKAEELIENTPDVPAGTLWEIVRVALVEETEAADRLARHKRGDFTFEIDRAIALAADLYDNVDGGKGTDRAYQILSYLKSIREQGFMSGDLTILKNWTEDLVIDLTVQAALAHDLSDLVDEVMTTRSNAEILETLETLEG